MKRCFLLFLLLCVGLGWGVQAQDRAQLPPVPDNSTWIRADKFDGGLNTFLPPEKLSSNQAMELINFLPYGKYWLKKREGYQKIQITPLGTIYGMGMADSANTKSRLFVVGDDDLYITDDLYDGTYKDIGGTTAEETFFTSTPFGLVFSNDGSDSCRLYGGDSAVTVAVWALGYCDSGTAEVDSDYTAGDTAWVEDSSKVWTDNYWIGYWCKCAGSLFEIFDNTTFRLYLLDCADTCDGVHYDIVSRPDSVSSTLGFPRGKATAYYKDKLFVSSKWYPWRIYYSHERLINDIDIDAMINLDMDAQDEIQRMVVFNGFLIVFGSNSMYGINTDLAATPITKGLGCSAPKSVAVGDDYIYFLSQPTGVYRFNGNIYGSMSYKLEKISDPIEAVLASVGAGVLDDACGVYANNQYWLAYSPDSCLVFDEGTNQWYGPQGFGFTEALPLVGDFRIENSEILYPSSDVSTNWSSTGANSWSVIDDQSNDADYISGNSKTARLGFTNLSNSATGAVIHDITVGCRAKVSYFINARIDVGLRANDTTYPLCSFKLTTSWNTYTASIEENPASGLAWTTGDIDSMVLNVFGYVESGHTDYISGLWAIPNYRSDLPTHDFLFASTNKNVIYQYGGVFADDTTSDGTYNVSGIVPTAYYKSGWFDLGSPINQYQMRKFWLDKTTDDDATVYLYKNHSTTAEWTLTVDQHGDTTQLFWLPPKVSGHEFQIKIVSAADSCQIKGWGALIRDLGERKD